MIFVKSLMCGPQFEPELRLPTVPFRLSSQYIFRVFHCFLPLNCPVCVCVCTVCPEIDVSPLQGVFPPRPQCSRDMLQTHSHPDRDKVLQEKEWLLPQIYQDKSLVYASVPGQNNQSIWSDQLIHRYLHIKLLEIWIIPLFGNRNTFPEFLFNALLQCWWFG